MDIVGIDIAKARFDAALLAGERVRPSAFSNTEAGFEQFLAWLMRPRADPSRPLRACLEATGNWGLVGPGPRGLPAHPRRAGRHRQLEPASRPMVPANSRATRPIGSPPRRACSSGTPGDAALIARFCRAQAPAVWTPPSAHLRELRELVRRCDALKAARVRELDRQKGGIRLTRRGSVDCCASRLARSTDRERVRRSAPAHQ
jgi:transposase